MLTNQRAKGKKYLLHFTCGKYSTAYSEGGRGKEREELLLHQPKQWDGVCTVNNNQPSSPSKHGRSVAEASWVSIINHLDVGEGEMTLFAIELAFPEAVLVLPNNSYCLTSLGNMHRKMENTHIRQRPWDTPFNTHSRCCCYFELNAIHINPCDNCITKPRKRNSAHSYTPLQFEHAPRGVAEK